MKKQEVTFFVKTGQQSPMVNKMFRAADFANGAVIRDGSGFEISVQWKEGEIVNAQRITRTQQNLRKAFEAQGYCVLGIAKLR